MGLAEVVVTSSDSFNKQTKQPKQYNLKKAPIFDAMTSVELAKLS